MRATTVVANVLGIALSIAAYIGPGTASAGFCGTPSPLRLALGDAYFELEDTGAGSIPPDVARHDPPHSSEPRLERLRERLRHVERLGGHGERTVCRKIDGEPGHVTWTFDLEQIERVAMPDGEATLTAYEFRHTVRAVPPNDRLVDGLLVPESIALPRNWHVDDDVPALSADRRFRRVAAASFNCASRCTLLMEIELHVRPVAEGIQIEQNLYVDGLGAERAIWRFGRHPGGRSGS